MEPKEPLEPQSVGEADAAPDDGWQVVRAKLARDARGDFLRSDYYKGPIAERQAAREAGAFEAELSKELPYGHQEVTPPDFSAIPNQGQCVACNILYDVTPAGVPVNILAMCTAPEFNPIAHDAIAEARFAARIIRGKPAKRLNVVYPIETGICE